MGLTNNKGHVYTSDKSHIRENASIALIMIGGGLVLICNFVYFVNRCRKGKCTYTCKDFDDEEDE